MMWFLSLVDIVKVLGVEVSIVMCSVWDICIDICVLQVGDLFVVFCGEHFDGYGFLEMVWEVGVVVVVVDIVDVGVDLL